MYDTYLRKSSLYNKQISEKIPSVNGIYNFKFHEIALSNTAFTYLQLCSKKSCLTTPSLFRRNKKAFSFGWSLVWNVLIGQMCETSMKQKKKSAVSDKCWIRKQSARWWGPAGWTGLGTQNTKIQLVGLCTAHWRTGKSQDRDDIQGRHSCISCKLTR